MPSSLQVRLPADLSQLVRDEAKSNGRKLAGEIAFVLRLYYFDRQSHLASSIAAPAKPHKPAVTKKRHDKNRVAARG